MKSKYNDSVPLVSISCLTFNHAKYIEQTIEGFLDQKTTFPFEILIHDDASTDDTVGIIRRYQAKYPDIIKPVFQSENQVSKGIRALHFIYNFSRAQGEFLAICDGDDYWIDPYKLQKQVDFLKQNSQYGFVHTGFAIWNEVKESIVKNRKPVIYNGEIFEKLILCNFVGTLTVCFRKNLIDNIDYSDVIEQKFFHGDIALWLTLTKLTNFYYINEITSVYRVLPISVSHGNVLKMIKAVRNGVKVRMFFMKKYSSSIFLVLRVKYLEILGVFKILVKWLIKF